MAKVSWCGLTYPPIRETYIRRWLLPGALTKFAEWMWSGKGKLSRRVGGCPDDRGTIYPPPFFPVVPRTPKLTRSSVAGCRMTPYLTTRSVGSEGESTGFGFGFTYLFKYAEGGGWHWGEHLAESRWVTLHNPHSHLSDSL